MPSQVILYHRRSSSAFRTQSNLIVSIVLDVWQATTTIITTAFISALLAPIFFTLSWSEQTDDWLKISAECWLLSAACRWLRSLKLTIASLNIRAKKPTSGYWCFFSTFELTKLYSVTVPHRFHDQITSQSIRTRWETPFSSWIILDEGIPRNSVKPKATLATGFMSSETSENPLKQILSSFSAAAAESRWENNMIVYMMEISWRFITHVPLVDGVGVISPIQWKWERRETWTIEELFRCRWYLSTNNYTSLYVPLLRDVIENPVLLISIEYMLLRALNQTFISTNWREPEQS